jgi:AraC family transcriptional regulator of arabinose operon
MDRRIETTIMMMENDPGGCEISALAASISLSVSRFRHLFNQQTGTTPSRYLKTVRFERAERLIRTTFVPIKEIVTEVGCSSDSHFWREFRQRYGMSPSKYREVHGLTHDGSKKKN